MFFTIDFDFFYVLPSIAFIRNPGFHHKVNIDLNWLCFHWSIWV